MSNFNSAPNRHGPTALQWAVVGGLIQQRQQIGLQKQSIATQNALLTGQKAGNEVLLAQLKQQQEIENNRREERMLDLWVAEFKHRGMSPLDASNQANAELTLYGLYVEVESLHQELLAKVENAIRSIPIKKPKKVSKQVEWMLFAIIPLLIFSLICGHIGQGRQPWPILAAISYAGYVVCFFVGPIVAVFQLIKYRGLPPLPPTEEQITRVSSEPEAWFQKKIMAIDDQLKTLPKSQLSDDSDFRRLVKSAIRQV